MSIYSDSKSNPSKKPDTIPVKPEGIPEELKQFKQWIVWRWVWNHKRKKWTKPPYSPLSHLDNYASSANEKPRATWGNFEDALSAYQAGGWDGVGFVFTSSDPYCGIDLDDCRNPETGEIEAWAREMLRKLDSLSEVSPRKTGAKVITKAKMPGERHKWKVESGAVEMYDKVRYFTVTGHRLSEGSGPYCGITVH